MSTAASHSSTPATPKYTAKKFRIGKEGATTDGRKIERAWLEQAAKNYNPKTYGARINLEHFKGILPDGPFKAYGDVLELSTEEEGGVLYLLADISPTQAAVEMNKARQKVYTSMELDVDFAGSGEAYLVGLAFTDSPASLGTDMLQFSATNAARPLDARKHRPENLFSEAMEADLEFTEVDTAPSVLESVKSLIAKRFKKADSQQHSMMADIVGCFEEFATTLQESMADINAVIELQNSHSSLQEKLGALEAAHQTLVHTLSQQPQHSPRTPATGGSTVVHTDC